MNVCVGSEKVIDLIMSVWIDIYFWNLGSLRSVFIQTLSSVFSSSSGRMFEWEVFYSTKLLIVWLPLSCFYIFFWEVALHYTICSVWVSLWESSVLFGCCFCWGCSGWTSECRGEAFFFSDCSLSYLINRWLFSRAWNSYFWIS